MENIKKERLTGWEVAKDLEATKKTIWERLIPEASHLKAMSSGVMRSPPAAAPSLPDRSRTRSGS